MKTTEEMTAYMYHKQCGLKSPSTIYHRIKSGSLTLNENGMIAKGTIIIRRMKLGRKSKVIQNN